MCKTFYGQDGNQIIDIIILSEKDLDYLLNDNNDIPITIIETFLALLKHSFNNDKGTFIQSNVEGEFDLKQMSNVQLDIKIKPKILPVIQKYYPDKNKHHLYTMKINIYSKEPKKNNK